MFGEFFALLLEVRLSLFAGELDGAVGIEAMPARQVFAVEDGPETFRRSRFVGLCHGEWCKQKGKENEGCGVFHGGSFWGEIVGMMLDAEPAMGLL